MGDYMTDFLAPLNAAVAAKLGWTQGKDVWHRPISLDAQKFAEIGNTPMDITRMIPLSFCEDIATMWEVVDNLPPEISFGLVRIGKKWLCQMGPEEGVKQETIEDTAPLAICKAFLKLKND